MRSRPGYAVSYVKVELLSRSPRLWGWSLRRAGSDNLLRRSEGGHGCAEDAWKAGRLAHARYEAEAARSLRPVEDAAREHAEKEELAC